jgi:hypothetical protein
LPTHIPSETKTPPFRRNRSIISNFLLPNKMKFEIERRNKYFATHLTVERKASKSLIAEKNDHHEEKNGRE